MTGTELHDLNTNGPMQGRGLSIDDFLTRANISKRHFENQRAWRRLLKKSTSNSSSTSDTFATAKTLPTDFRRTLPRRTLVLINPDNAQERYDMVEIPIEKQYEHQTSFGYFFIDRLNGNYYICGTPPKTLTHAFFYIHKTADIAADTSWGFGTDFDPYLVYDVAARYQLGEDYDDISARNANANAAIAEGILRDAIKEDDSLQRSALGV